MAEPQTERDALEILAAEFVARLRRGEFPSVTEYATAHPELAADIHELFPTIASMERLKFQKAQHARGGQVSLGGPRLERLGDFRILREIGRGGMGIVFEAEQESLGRRVAIKVLPRHALLAPEQLKRFQREARIAAGLHHTNIVSVFGVGQHAGFHYYVMQYIAGVGLDRVITRLAQGQPVSPVAETGTTRAADTAGGAPPELDRVLSNFFGQPSAPAVLAPRQPPPLPAKAGLDHLPTALRSLRAGADYWATAAGIGLQAARALHYAHSQGTLHCDVKPANLLLDAHGFVWITDFGVAKALLSEKVTQTGDITGTLHYIAPERFRGQTDPRSDVYSLGLTLYELLTLRPAFDEPNRQSLIRRVMEGAPVTPRKLNSQIPRDLETIVLKATARDPSHRYPSAEALAEDLERYLQDRPVHARRVTPAEHLWRWAHRNPVIAGWAAATVALLIAVTSFAAVSYVQTRRANILVRQVLELETRQRQQSEETSKLALGALDKIYAQSAASRPDAPTELTVRDSGGKPIDVPLQPALSKAETGLLENLLQFYDRLAVQPASDQVRLQAAQANRRVAEIRAQLGQLDEAQAACQRTLKIYSGVAQDQITPEVALEIAAAHDQQGNLHRSKSMFREARQAYRSAINTLEPLAQNTSAPELRFQLARTYYHLGTLDRQGLGPIGGASGGRPPDRDGEPPFGPPPPRRDSADGRPPPRHPDDSFGPPPRREGREGPEGRPPPPPRPDEQRGPPPRHEGREGPEGRPPHGPPHPPPDDLSEPPQHARPFDDAPAGQPPRRNAGPHRSGHQADESNLSKAIALLTQLRSQYPAVGLYRHLLACCYRDLPAQGPSQYDRDEVLGQAMTILEQLVKDFPQEPDYRFDLAEAYAVRGFRPPMTHAMSGQSEQDFRKAVEIFASMAAEYPTAPRYTAGQVHTLFRLARVQADANQSAAAQASLRTGIALLSGLERSFPEATSYRLWSAAGQQLLAELLDGERKWPEARALLEEAEHILTSLPASARELPPVHRLLRENYLLQSDVLADLGQTKRAEEAHRRAVQFDDAPPPAKTPEK